MQSSPTIKPKVKHFEKDFIILSEFSEQVGPVPVVRRCYKVHNYLYLVSLHSKQLLWPSIHSSTVSESHVSSSVLCANRVHLFCSSSNTFLMRAARVHLTPVTSLFVS